MVLVVAGPHVQKHCGLGKLICGMIWMTALTDV